MKYYGYIYLTTNKINGKKYIGLSTKWNKNSLKNYFGSGRNITKALNKYGKENFSKKILYYAKTKDELELAEKVFIRSRNAVKNDNYYNLTDGGDGGDKWDGKTEEQKQEFVNHLKDVFGNGRLSGGNNPAAKKVLMLDLNYNVIDSFSCIKEVHDRYGYHRERVSNACKNNKIYKNCRWVFFNDYNKIKGDKQ